ncbi:hypothetical protein [Plebeiibacterium sediminum]|uniref:DUF4292 domain-containing protein n=1 Tax=Plebeiibacterium sediminum TaxID=2992112 RepID=A0AAE3M1M5_9BACT|nr:hypothetical protein [Plebeiobacterium sediminum]MCW3785557.1 hypothetical protein [Plebeiobacterium sediminum]
MRVFLTIFLLLSSITFSSCSSAKKFAPANKEIQQPLTGGNKSALYKAKMKVFGNFFSGLVLFKYNKENNDYNVVLLTEVGLTLCEFYCVNNQIEVKKASSLFQSKMAQKTLAEDFGYLIYELGAVKKVAEGVYKNSDKVKYTLGTEAKVQRIRKRRLINGIIVDLEKYKQGVPSSIKFKHRGIKFNMELSLLKVS